MQTPPAPMTAPDIPVATRDPVSSPPQLGWAPLSQLVIPEFQRGVTERAARKLIERIAEEWDWRRCGAIVVAPMQTQGGIRMQVIDGQHRAAAALLRGDIERLPAVLVSAAEVQDGAVAFVGINRNRRALSACAVFWAELAAGDAETSDIAGAAADADVAVLRNPKAAHACQPGETMSVQALRSIYRAHGRDGLTRVLAIARSAEAAPILADHLRAVAGVLWDDELEGLRDAALADAIRADWTNIAYAAAIQSEASGQTRARCLAINLARAARR